MDALERRNLLGMIKGALDGDLNACAIVLEHELVKFMEDEVGPVYYPEHRDRVLATVKQHAKMVGLRPVRVYFDEDDDTQIVIVPNPIKPPV